MRTFAIAALAGLAVAGSLEVRGPAANLQMHNTYLKVWSQADVTPSFSSLMGTTTMTHGLPLTHTVKLTNLPQTCAGVWGDTPCVPYGEPADYPKMFYCAWTDAANGVLEITTGPYSPTLRSIVHEDGTVLAREARLECAGPHDGLSNTHHEQRLRVYFGADGSDERLELAYVGRTGKDRIGVIATATPTMAPTVAPTAAPTLAPTPAPTPPTPAPTPNFCFNSGDFHGGAGDWSAHTRGTIANCGGDCDADNHCASGLVCVDREVSNNPNNGNAPVSGCNGSPLENMDYCADPRNGPNCIGTGAFHGGTNDWSAHTRGPIANCGGDCDHDHHCASGLVCVQREQSHNPSNGNAPIPGCSGSPVENMDYCAHPSHPNACTNYGVFHGGAGDWSAHTRGTIANCGGDCDADHHCASGLVCVDREVSNNPNNGNAPVPGCRGTPLENMDYCGDPSNHAGCN